MPYTPSLLEVLKLPEIVARQWWSPQRLREWQNRRLRKLVRHAYDNVAFYRRRWDAAGISPAEIESVDDLHKLPVIPSGELKSTASGDLLAAGTNISKCHLARTSGSTGRPLTITYTRSDQFNVLKAMSVRHYMAHGVSIHDKLARFSPDPDEGKMHGWYERFGFWRRLTLDSTLPAREWILPLRHQQPDVIAATPMTLHELVLELQASGENLPAPRLIISSGARLEPEMRSLLASALGAQVIDAYGAHEGGFLAWECAQCEAYHLNADIAIVEVLKDGAPAVPGQPGEIVITNLFSNAMPFIRYNLGDVVTLSAKKPRCGRSLPLMEEVWGRNDDVVYLPSGKSIGVYPIYMTLLRQPFISEWLLEQEVDGKCTLRIVPSEAVAEDSLIELQRAMEDTLGNELPVTLQLVEQIHRDPKAKWKTIVSMLRAARAS